MTDQISGLEMQDQIIRIHLSAFSSHAYLFRFVQVLHRSAPAISVAACQ